MSSKSVNVSWTRGRTYFKANNSYYDHLWKKAKAKHYNSVSDAGYTYWDHVTNAASLKSFERGRVGNSLENEPPLLSAETQPESNSLLNFKAFAREYPEKLFPLLTKLRPEFQEMFIEYYLLEKSQSFIGKTHGCIQTRIWQQLRIIEQAVGSLIILGIEPNAEIIRPILRKACVESTPYGSLTFMILKYAENQNYADVALRVGAPIPAIRKIFRPIITTLLADKDIKAVAVGAYLRNLTHHASLTGAGLSKRCVARARRVKTLRFHADPVEKSSLLSFGAVSKLQDTPWCMFEISSDHRMEQISPLLQEQGKRIFGKKASQIFSPLNAEGELAFGYIFVRSVSPKLVRAMTRIRGISEMAAVSPAEGEFMEAVTIPNEEVQAMLEKQNPPAKLEIHSDDFVEILTGKAARYCGTVKAVSASGEVIVEVNFPTGRYFLVTADETCVKLLPKVPAEQRAFWGVRLD